MKVIVLGAGLLGVTSAYFLRQLGHEVVVIDRQASAAAETSFANGGQISVSHAEPWANPSAPLKVLKWLGQEDAPLLFPGAGDASQAQFWTGLRPATPSNVPVIGATKLPNLFLNTGHGTLGWTHACGSGRSIARIVSGLTPEVDFAFTRATAPVARPRVLGAAVSRG